MNLFDDEHLINQIKAIGQGLIDNAENIVTNLENKSNIIISIYFNGDSIPAVNVNTEFFPNKLLEYYKNNS